MLFSIIIPVYNVQDYLRECVESVVGQPFQDYEIILVDDGSTDASPQICDEMAAADSRITVIHKPNGGLSDARNAGIKAAKGTYLLFLDSDDALRIGCLSELAGSAASCPDVVVTEIQNTCEVEKDKSVAKELFNVSLQSKTDLIKFVFKDKEHTWASVQYIFKREYLEANGFQFEKGVFHEDVAWTAQAICLASSFEVFGKNWYIRRVNREGSITNSVNAKRTVDVINIVVSQLNDPCFDRLSPEEKKIVFSRLTQSLYFSLSFCRAYNKDEIKTIGALLDKNRKLIASNTYELKHILFITSVKLFGACNSLKVFKILKI